jgi:hypothetical protein
MSTKVLAMHTTLMAKEKETKTNSVSKCDKRNDYSSTTFELLKKRAVV